MNNSTLSMFLTCDAFNLGKFTVDLLTGAGPLPGAATGPLPLLLLLPGAGTLCGSGLSGRICPVGW